MFHLSVTRTMGNRALPIESPEWHRLRKQILIRDNVTCASCGYASPHPTGRGMKVDHRDGDASNNDPDNLRVHCPPCEGIRHCGLHGMMGCLVLASSNLDQLDIIRRTREIFETSGKIPRVRDVDPLAARVEISVVDFANILLKVDWADLPDEKKKYRGFFTKQAEKLFAITLSIGHNDDSDQSEFRAKQILAMEASLPWISFEPERHETLQNFLDTWRPSSTSQSDIAWICVSNARLQRPDPSGDIAGLCRAWDESCANNQASVSELDRLAHKFDLLSGKWLVFAPGDKVDALWARIARSTHAGTLGSEAKVSPHDEDDPSKNHVICVFTTDYTTYGDVNRVRESLRRLGVKGKIGYKPNVYTYCGVYAKNKWSIAPTRFHS